MTLVPLDPTQVAIRLNGNKRQISTWLDQRKIDYIPNELRQFQEYSSKVLERIQQDVINLTIQKIDAITKNRNIKIADIKYPDLKLALIGLGDGGGSIGWGFLCDAIASSALTSLGVVATGLIGIPGIFYLGKRCIHSLDNSRPDKIKERIRLAAQNDQDQIRKAFDKLYSELGQLKTEKITAENKTLQNENSQLIVTRQNLAIANGTIADLRENSSIALASYRLVSRAISNILIREQRDTIEKLERDNQLSKEAEKKLNITVMELHQKNRETADEIAIVRRDNARNIQSSILANGIASRADRAAKNLQKTVTELSADNQVNAYSLAQLQIENAANLENAERVNLEAQRVTVGLQATIEKLRQSNESTVADLAQLQIENNDHRESAGRANQAAQRAESAADELRNTHAEALTRIEKVHKENFEMFLRTLEQNSSEKSVQRLYREGQKRVIPPQQSLPQPVAVNREDLLEELTLANELPHEDFIAVNWEGTSQESEQAESSVSGNVYHPDPQNWAADIRMEMDERNLREAGF